MAVTYTDVDKVAQKLGFPAEFFDANSTPTNTYVEELINEAEDDIDYSTGHAWREKTVDKEYIHPDTLYRYGTGISLNLENRKIRSIDSLHVWDGSTWEDWVQTRTEGRNKDYWIDYTNGAVYLISVYALFEQGVYVGYKYGETTVNKDIQRAATLMAAIEILDSPEFSVVLFTESSQDNKRHGEKVKRWQDKVNNILERHSEFKVV